MEAQPLQQPPPPQQAPHHPAAAPQLPRSTSNRISRSDPRYEDLIRRGFSKRFVGRPEYVRVATSTAQVVEAVQDAVRDKMRVAVRSGGHCLEGFVADPAVRVVIDLSLMTGVAYDPDMHAFVVEAGTTVGEMYRRLFLGWGVVVPAAESPDVGVGGHVLGGAFGFLCREHGLAADHLYAVEVVVVDESGTARSVIATREPSDPNRDLWWAHTGGGGGNFGVVTRYWFRSPGATSADPAMLLPRAPDSILVFRATWKWDQVDQAAFITLLRNGAAWCERHSDADSPFARLFSLVMMQRRQAGALEVKGLSTAGPEAEQLADAYLAALADDVDAPFTRSVEHRSWLAFALNPFPELFKAGTENALFKGKDAFLRRRFTDRQLAVVHDYLTRSDHDVPGGGLGFLTYGGRVNRIASGATASAQRDAVISMSCVVGWGDPREEAPSLAWIRAFYRDLFAETGGVPAPGDLCDGAMINHPDVDLADPAWNTSGVPWHTLYYKDNYPRLQQVKARWDPQNVFHHALSIRR